MTIHLPRPREGDEVGAELIARFFAAVESAALDVAPGGGLAIDNGQIRLADAPAMWIKLTSKSGTAHAWTQQLRTGGAWADGIRSGTISADPALDVNGSTSLTLPTIVRAWRGPEGDLLFQGSPC